MDNIKSKNFKELDSDLKMLEIVDKINSGYYESDEDFDWYNLENYIDKNFHNLKIDEIKYIQYNFQQRFIKLNSKIIQGYDKDIINECVLWDLCDNYPYNISRKELVGKTYIVKASKTSAIVDKALKFFELYNIVKKSKIGEYNQIFYSLDTDKWFDKSKYIINDYQLLASLSSLITSYINIGFVKTFNIQNFFSKISELIEFAIRPSILHNKYMDIEYIILEAIEEKLLLDIIYEGSELTIEPIKIFFDTFDKYLKAKDINNDKIIELPISEISVNENPVVNQNIVPLTQSAFMIENPINKQYVKEEKILEVILECDSIIYEYYQMKPLANMQVFDEEEKIKEFVGKYDIPAKDNKFYIVAQDKEDMIISTVLHTLNNVKILSPNNLNDKIASMLKSYLDRTDIDICKSDEPVNPIEDTSKNFEIDDKKEEQNSNIESNQKLDDEGKPKFNF